jgi:hypothetical protein
MGHPETDEDPDWRDDAEADKLRDEAFQRLVQESRKPHRARSEAFDAGRRGRQDPAERKGGQGTRDHPKGGVNS